MVKFSLETVYRWCWVFLIIIVAIGGMVYLLIKSSDTLFQSIARLHIRCLFLIGFMVVLLCIVANYLRGIRFRYALGNQNEFVGSLYAMNSIYVSQLTNFFVPARLGDLTRLCMLKHTYNTPYKASLAAIGIERFFDLCVVVGFGIGSLFLIRSVDKILLKCDDATIRPDNLIITGLVIITVFFTLLLTASIKTNINNNLFKKAQAVLIEVQKLTTSKSTFVILSTLSIGIWLLDSIVLYCIGFLFGLSIPVSIVLLSIAIGNLIKAIPITPGGLLIYEGGIATLLISFNYPENIAWGVATFDHLVKNSVTLLGGTICFYYYYGWLPTLMKIVFKRVESLISALTGRF